MTKNRPVNNLPTALSSIVAALLCTAMTNAVLADKPPLFAPACEAALAKSALPSRLRDKATAYLWNGNGYEMPTDDDSAFHCLAARKHPDSAIPVCFTSSGVDSVMAGLVQNSTLAMRRETAVAVKEAFDAKVSEGSFVAPVVPGINYMMSEYNWIHQSAENTFWNTPAHVMFFAPNVTADAVGSRVGRFGERGFFSMWRRGTRTTSSTCRQPQEIGRKRLTEISMSLCDIPESSQMCVPSGVQRH